MKGKSRITIKVIQNKKVDIDSYPGYQYTFPPAPIDHDAGTYWAPVDIYSDFLACCVERDNAVLREPVLTTETAQKCTNCLYPGPGVCCWRSCVRYPSLMLNTSLAPVRRAACSTGSDCLRPRLAQRPTGRDARSPAASSHPRRAWTRRGRLPRPSAHSA